MKIIVCNADKAYAEKLNKMIMKAAEKNNVQAFIDIVVSENQLLFFMDTKFSGTDLIYLGQYFGEKRGISFAKKLLNRGYKGEIIFCAEDEKDAAEGYDVNAIGYIFKGQENSAIFERAFLRGAKLAEKRNSSTLSLFRSGVHIKLPVEDIVYFEVRHRLVTVHYLKAGERMTFEFYSSLAAIEDELSPKGFLRVHSAYVVAAKFIEKKAGNQLVLSTGESLPIGRSYLANLKSFIY